MLLFLTSWEKLVKYWGVFFLMALWILGCTGLSTRYQLGIQKANIRAMSLEPVLCPDIEMHTGELRKIVADEEKQFLVTCSLDKTIKVWKLQTGELLNTLHVPISHDREGKIYSVAISPNGKTIAASGWTGIDWEGACSIYIFDTQTGRLLYKIPELPNVVNDLAYSKIGTFLVACLGGENGIRVYNTTDYKLSFVDRHYGNSTYCAEFSSSGNLATACYDGLIRLYDRDFHLLKKEPTHTGQKPYTVRFSTEGSYLAVSFSDTVDIDVLDGRNLDYLFTADKANIEEAQTHAICWGVDGSLYGAGTYVDKRTNKSVVRRWFNQGKGIYQDMAVSRYPVQSLYPLVDGSIVFATADPSFGILYESSLLLNKRSPIVDFRGQHLFLSPDAHIVKFSFDSKDIAYFSLDSLFKKDAGLLFHLPKNSDGKYSPLFPPKTSGIEIEDVYNGDFLEIDGIPLELTKGELARCFAVSPDEVDFVLGSDLYLRLLDRDTIEIWKTPVPATVWSVNISNDNTKIVVGLGDGTIRWYSKKNGQELLALFAHPDQKRWVAWTSQGFYTASVAGESLLKQHKNKGAEVLADFLPIAPTFRRPDMIAKDFSISIPEKLVDSKDNEGSEIVEKIPLETGITQETGISTIKVITHSQDLEKPSLYIVAIGISNYPDTKWKLQFAAKDAQDFAQFMQKQQNNLYRTIYTNSLIDERATKTEILKALDWLVKNAKSKDVTMIFLSGHGENDANGYYYFLPVHFQLKNLPLTSVPFADLQKSMSEIQGKVILFIDTCRSGRLGEKKIDIGDSLGKLAKSKNELILFASSSGTQESLEKQEWGNGAFTKALLEGFSGKADFFQQGHVTVYRLFSYISERVQALSNGKQTPTITIPNSIPDFIILRIGNKL